MKGTQRGLSILSEIIQLIASGQGRIAAWSVLLQSLLRGRSTGWPSEGRQVSPACLLPGFLPWQPGSGARRRLRSCHLFSWLHCLATACPCLLSALEEDAFLHGPSGRTTSHALARAAPHDGFNDYNLLMWGLLSHVADPIPSGVSFLEEMLGGKLCIVFMLGGVCACTHRYRCVHRCEPVHTGMDVNIDSSELLWSYFLHRDHLAN